MLSLSNLTIEKLGMIAKAHSVSLGTDHPFSKPQPSVFFLSPQALKTYFPPSRQKALIIAICCTCLTIIPILISEETTNLS